MSMKIPGLTTKVWYRVNLKMRLDDLQGFIHTVEMGFRKQQKVADTKWKRSAPKGLSNEQLEEYYEQLSREGFLLSTEFPALVRRTAFVHLYSIFEKALVRLCERVHECNRRLASPSADKKNKGIHKAQQYLKRTAKVPFPDQNSDWEALRRMGDLRNWFVHSTGKQKISGKLEAYLKKKPSMVRIGLKNSITLQEGFCPHAIDVVRRFYAQLLAVIPDEMLDK
jgi:hypothetical protein